ncbi:MAG: hypothetical protein LC769_01320 [Chloroflexi bacterium]|nr:hypothetical protein [Chloroflexota bacterium]
MEGIWQEGAGGLLLLAAAHETGLITTLTASLPTPAPTTRLGRMGRATIRTLLLTLLFLTAVGLRRTWDLRSYTGDALALLTGRLWAFGYRHVERFLALIARAGAADPLTDALAGWTTHLWQPEAVPIEAPHQPLYYYIDGHRKPVYSADRLPRGLIGRTGKIEGCRALVLLHDDQGHPLLATTHRGDQHLTIGLPQIVARHAQARRRAAPDHVVVDREGMGGDFLAGLVAVGYTVVTILRADQYEGVASFTDVGPFVPLTTDRHGIVLREVAPAHFALPIPEQPGVTLPLSVALIRDLRCQVPVPPRPDDDDLDDPDWLPPHERWLAGLPPDQRQWWAPGWKATSAPGAPTQPKLIPIVSTAETRDAVSLARLYIARWPRQENIIRDWLLPLALDTNHGYAKTAIENSEVAKQRATLEHRRDRLQQWADSARKRYQQASRRADQRYAHRKEQGEALYRELNQQQTALADQGVEYSSRQGIIRERKAEIDAQLEELSAHYWRAVRERDAEWHKLECYCQDQRTVLRQLEDLTARDQQMYELTNDKDQVMTVCKVALANLGMWVRDRYFPADYAHATWQRLAPFFQVPGQVTWERERVRVDLRPFNDRHLTRDLHALCERVTAAAPRLPDGRHLVMTVAARPARISDLHRRC